MCNLENFNESLIKINYKFLRELDLIEYICALNNRKHCIMKFIVSSSYLLKQLQILGGVINNNNTLPILDNFLFELDKNELKISASDLETTMSTIIDVDSEDIGSIAVPARLLLDTLKTFSEQPLTFLVEEGNNTVELSSSQGKYALAYADSDEFPNTIEIEDGKSTALPAECLATAINKTFFAAGNDDMRPAMSGVLFQFSTEGITFVATDAHKLVKYSRQNLSAPESAEFIMPKKPLNLLKGILTSEDEEEVLIEYNAANVRFTFDNTQMVSRLIDAKYPNYQAVIPDENPNILNIDRQQFLNSVRRVSIFSNKTTHQIKLSLAGAELNISAEDIDFSNKAEERLTCDYKGDDLKIGFNSRFLTEMLNNLSSDQVQLEMSLPNRAGILSPLDGSKEGEKVLMLVMPVMLNI